MRSLQVRRRRSDVVHIAEVDRMQSLPTTDQTPTRTERAILAGGCFWGLEDLLRRAKGVVTTRVGYIGGELPDPTYTRHHGHAEAVEVTFDPSILTYRALLELFFQIHDPTTYEQQGSDVGPSYRSAIFYTSEKQMDVALETIAEIEASGRWPGPVVSEINPEEPFWEAEPEHQKYLQRRPGGYSCHFERPAWRLDRAKR
jgi:peptide-methionine (S)-S-oxide reductase